MKKMKKKSSKRSKASFKETRTHTDKPKSESIHSGTNTYSGPSNRADDQLKHLMARQPVGLKINNRRYQ